ncbi:MAG TPA: endonuclease/exonuclease/phosphatase family protein [Anaerolineae bacterium]|nr:endonuclease/exonuclease/phosphatase family protein [Anaerolineae bacterium]
MNPQFQPFSVLCANLGNASLKYFNDTYKNKLASKKLEKRLTRRIKKLNPDIIVFQESLGFLEYLLRKPRKPQIRRLVGKQYSIVVDSRFQFEGIAVHTKIGKIIGCKKGKYKKNKRTEAQGSQCDNGFATQAATIRLKGGFQFDLVNFHLHSTNVFCRVNTLINVFAGNLKENRQPLIKQQWVLLIGDFNFDPWRYEDKSTHIWKKQFKKGWAGSALHYYNRLSEDGLPELTSIFPFLSRTIDFAVSNFAIGTLDTLGVTTDTKRLDGGKGCDHRALWGLIQPKAKFN